MSARARLAALSLTAVIVGCEYAGDGQLTDHGFIAHQRYVLDLGPVDLSQRSQQSFKMANLPSEGFTFGLQLAGTNWNESAVQATVRLLLVNEKDQVVFDVTESLPKWVWSGVRPGDPFVYLRGVNSEIPIGAGSVRLEPVVKADGGWGTYVQARRTGRYQLTFETVKPDPYARQVAARLVAVGGGWK